LLIPAFSARASCVKPSSRRRRRTRSPTVMFAFPPGTGARSGSVTPDGRYCIAYLLQPPAGRGLIGGLNFVRASQAESERSGRWSGWRRHCVERMRPRLDSAST
jgi:hypothetical protein